MKKTLALLVVMLLIATIAPLTVMAEGPTELVMWGGWSGDSIRQFTEMLDTYNGVGLTPYNVQRNRVSLGGRNNSKGRCRRWGESITQRNGSS